MSKAPHATDIRDAQWIRTATHFNAMAFIGRGVFDREDDFPSLAEAKAAALRIEARNPGRSAMIYAVTAEGRSCLVTAQLEELIMEFETIIGKSYTAKSAAIRALKRSGMEPDQAEVRAEGNAWTIRRPNDPPLAHLVTYAKPAKAEPRRKSVLRAQEDAREQAGAAKAQAAASKRAAKATAKPAAKPAPAPRRKSDENQPKTRARYDRSTGAAPKAAPASAPKRGAKAYAEALEAARSGKLPAAPDFSAETHKPYRAKLARVSELAKAGDLKALRAETAEWKPYNSSMAPLIRYRDLCIEALAAKR